MDRRAFVVGLLLVVVTAGCSPVATAPQNISLSEPTQPPPTQTLAWVVITPTPAQAADAAPLPTVTLMPSLMPTATAWPTPTPTPASNAHFTMVLLGIDSRPANPSWMTDTMMLIDINPMAQTASLLSIPRDLWFWTDIPGEPLRQVNRFYALAELAEDGAGGPAVKEMLNFNLGVDVDAYAVIDFQVFVSLINAIGGVDIELSQPLSDPTYPDAGFGYDPLYLPAGLNHLDGETALKYARTRHVDSDYGRISRQQRLLLAIREKLMQPDVWPAFIAQLPSLWAEVRGWVDTDLTIDQLMQLALFARSVPLESIEIATLRANDDGVVARNTVDDGRSVWAVVPDQADAFVRDLFRME
ncbi:MAG: hypothetical protein Kow00120_22500 [Anaerolineae bacterium]